MHIVRHAVIWTFCWRSDLCALHYEDLATCPVLLLYRVSTYSDQVVYSKCVFQNICINSFLETRSEWPPNPSLQIVMPSIIFPKLLFMVLRHMVYSSLSMASSDLTRDQTITLQQIFLTSNWWFAEYDTQN